MGRLIGELAEEEFNGDVILTPEILIESFMEDPRVISAEYKDGTFYIDTIAGPIVFRMDFEKENA